MDRQTYNDQLDYIRRELTRVTQELAYLDGPQRQTLALRQTRLAAELHRLESQRYDFAVALFSASRTASVSLRSQP